MRHLIDSGLMIAVACMVGCGGPTAGQVAMGANGGGPAWYAVAGVFVILVILGVGAVSLLRLIPGASGFEGVVIALGGIILIGAGIALWLITSVIGTGGLIAALVVAGVISLAFVRAG